MLYDKRWDYKVKADPLSLESLIAWLETMPADKSYDFYCQGGCLLGQWVKTIDGDARATDGGPHDEPFFYFVEGRRRDFRSFGEIAHGPRSYKANRWTFGAALDRARKLADASCPGKV